MLPFTEENHLTPDRRMSVWSFVGLGASNQSVDDYVRAFLSIKLPTDASEDLLEVFDRVRAVMVYGCYYYPLFSLGVEELYRYHEALIRTALGSAAYKPNGKSHTFNRMIEIAVEQNVLSEKEGEAWHAGRWLRNRSSHRESTFLLGPNNALDALQNARDRTEKLLSQNACKHETT